MAEGSNPEDKTPIHEILKVKLGAASARTKVFRVEDLSSTWQLDNSDLTALAIQARLACEYATAELKAIETLCDEIVHHLPTYVESNTGQPRHMAVELGLLLERARRYLGQLHRTFLDRNWGLYHDGGAVIEARLRVQDALVEIDANELKFDMAAISRAQGGAVEEEAVESAG